MSPFSFSPGLGGKHRRLCRAVCGRRVYRAFDILCHNVGMPQSDSSFISAWITPGTTGIPLSDRESHRKRGGSMDESHLMNSVHMYSAVFNRNSCRSIPKQPDRRSHRLRVCKSLCSSVSNYVRRVLPSKNTAPVAVSRSAMIRHWQSQCYTSVSNGQCHTFGRRISDYAGPRALNSVPSPELPTRLPRIANRVLRASAPGDHGVAPHT